MGIAQRFFRRVRRLWLGSVEENVEEIRRMEERRFHVERRARAAQMEYFISEARHFRRSDAGGAVIQRAMECLNALDETRSISPKDEKPFIW